MNPGIQFSKSKVDMKTVLLPRRTKPATENKEKPSGECEEKPVSESEEKSTADSQQKE